MMNGCFVHLFWNWVCWVSLGQMFYGTALYFFQFFHNGRHKGHSMRDVVLFVGITNLTWLIFPIWGLATSIRLILDGSYGLLR